LANKNLIGNLAGQIVGNVVTQYLSLLQNEVGRGNSYRDALVAVKSGNLSPKDITLRPEQPIQVPPMVGELLKSVVSGYLPLVEEENAKTRSYHNYLDQIAKGSLDPETVVVTDDGVRIVPVLPPEPEEEVEPVLVPGSNKKNKEPKAEEN
jgi:hypothetical protein